MPRHELTVTEQEELINSRIFKGHFCRVGDELAEMHPEHAGHFAQRLQVIRPATFDFLCHDCVEHFSVQQDGTGLKRIPYRERWPNPKDERDEYEFVN